jgi:single-stranded-DNA-specific exonuclease
LEGGKRSCSPSKEVRERLNLQSRFRDFQNLAITEMEMLTTCLCCGINLIVLNLKQPMNEYTWLVTSPKPEAKTLSSELGLPQEIAQILVNRGVNSPESAQEFLFGTLDNLYDPFLMSGMRKAVARIRGAISEKEKIIIFGDYDVDGVLSVVMLLRALKALGGEVDYYIPNRLKEGYGLKEKYVDTVLEREAGLVISADCGVKATRFVKRAREKGIDVIITDHHHPGERLPEALAILNPVLPESGYPDKNLAGVGVVFKLIQGLFGEKGDTSFLPQYLRLVSIGTVADVAELKGENRLLVKIGLEELQRISNIGLKGLMAVCDLEEKKISVGDVGYRIGPRINAAGRMGKADLAVRLFLSKSHPESLELAHQLDALNSQRQRIEGRIHEQALTQIEKKSLDKRYKFLILGCEEWHRGVIGIISSRVKDIFYRPVILFAYEDGKAYGSGRSISEFSLIDCLNDCKDFFLSYGGHRQAVGCVLHREKMNSFKKAINSIADERLLDEHLRRKIYIDAKMDFNLLDLNFFEKYYLLFPFGMGNPSPVFLTEKAEVVSEPRRIHNRHSKFLVKQNGKTFEALGWEKAELTQIIHKGDRVDLVYSLQFSKYLGEERFSVSLKDIKVSPR